VKAGRSRNNGWCIFFNVGLDPTLGLQARGTGPEDKVSVAFNTCTAAWSAVHGVCARRAPAEHGPAIHDIGAARIGRTITPRTRALSPTRLCGGPAGLEPILDIARRHVLRAIADAAQMYDARRKRRRIGAGIGARIRCPVPRRMQAACAEPGMAPLADEALSPPMGPRLTAGGAQAAISALNAAP